MCFISRFKRLRLLGINWSPSDFELLFHIIKELVIQRLNHIVMSCNLSGLTTVQVTICV